MEIFRLSRQKFKGTLSGAGAAEKGGRWNSPGVELIYAAANRSLAMAEVAVHLTLATLPDDYLMMTILIPDDIAFLKLDVSDLPENWNTFPHTQLTQAVGDRFITDNKFCVLKIPSAVVQGDYNILINSKHPDFPKVKILSTEKFLFDNRLFR